jgi:hypothetical protein
MMQAIHLFKKDLRLLWPVILLLLMLLTFQVWFLWRDPWIGNPVNQVHLHPWASYPEAIAPYFLLNTLIVMVLLLIHNPFVGKSFYLTRPISKKSLWISKCGFIALFGVIAPVAANFIVLFHYGLELQYAVPCLMEILSRNFVLSGLIALIAVLITPFAQSAKAYFIGVMLLSMTAWWYPYSSTWILYVVLSLMVIILQYVSRRIRLSATIFIVGMLLIAGTNRHFEKAYRWIAGAHDVEVQNLRVSFENYHADGFTQRFISAASPGKRRILCKLGLSNAQPNASADFLKLEGMLDFRDGTRIPLSGGTQYIDGVAESGAEQQSTYYEVDKTLYETHGNRPGTFSGEATFKLVRYDIAGRLPLQRGASFKYGSKILSIYQTSSTVIPGLMEIILRYRFLVSSDSNPLEPRLVMRLNSNQVWPKHNDLDLGPDRRLVLPGPMLQYSEGMWFLPYQEYLLCKEMLVYNKVETGPFTKKFEVRNFRMSDYAEKAGHNPSNPSINPKSVESKENVNRKP